MRREGCTHPTAWVRGWCRIDATIHMHACAHPAAWARPSRRGAQAYRGIGARMPAHTRGLGLASTAPRAGLSPSLVPQRGRGTRRRTSSARVGPLPTAWRGSATPHSMGMARPRRASPGRSPLLQRSRPGARSRQPRPPKARRPRRVSSRATGRPPPQDPLRVCLRASKGSRWRPRPRPRRCLPRPNAAGRAASSRSSGP